MDWEEFEEELEEETKKPFNMAHFLRMLKYIRPYRRAVLTVAALMGFGVITNLIEPYLLRVAIDLGILGKDMAAINRVAIVFLLFRLGNWAAGIFRVRLINQTGQSVLYDLRQELFSHIQKLSLRFYDHRPVGKIMSRITNDVNAINNLISGGLATILSEGLSLFGIAALMLVISWRLALMAFLVLPLLGVLFFYLRPMMESAWMNVRRTVANINADLNETISGIRVIQAFSREDLNTRRFGCINEMNRRTTMRAFRLEMLTWPSIDFIGVVGTFLVIWYGALQVIRGTISLGYVMAFVNYQWRFWGPISAISKVYSQVLSAMASAERVFEFLDTEPEIQNAPDAVPLPPIRGQVRFEHVSFRYEEDDRMVLQDINLTVEPGQVVAMVGPTGAGKTSIVNLLMRFYDPTEGRVLVDGHDLRQVTIESLRSQMAVVLQESFLFSGTIGDNIRYSRSDVTLEEVERAAAAVRLDEFIESLPAGYDTEVQERGGRLSVGQRQLVAFARALLANPRILILDEATSSVDIQTERLIQQALETLLQGRTAFIIAHRLSTVEHADRIIVLDDGRIVEEGTHRQLLARRGLYYRLYLTQFAGQRPVETEVEASSMYSLLQHSEA
jgi:ATP-binding cassette subfamily B multidrug efflux pump